MGTSIEQVEAFLEAEDVPFTRTENALKVVCGMRSFVSHHTGDHAMEMFLDVSDSGESIEIYCPRLYDLRLAVNPGAVCELLMSLNYQSRMLVWELNRSDGEIRVTVGLAIEDGELAPGTLRQILSIVPKAVDYWHSTIARAISTGELPPPAPSRYEPRLEDLVKDAGGIDQLRELFNRSQRRSPD